MSFWRGNHQRHINAQRCPKSGTFPVVPDLTVQPFGGIGASGVGFYRSKYGFLHFCHLRSVTETPTWGLLEKILSTRYPPYTPEKMKKMQSLVGDPKVPFTREPGSADRPRGVYGWVYGAGLAIIGGLAGVLYREKQNAKS